jgi:hypothetical protein
LQLDDKNKVFNRTKKEMGLFLKNSLYFGKKCQKLPHLNTPFMEFVNSKQDFEKHLHPT